METNPTTWRLAAAGALLLAVVALWISPEFSLVCLGLSLIAGLISLVIVSNLVAAHGVPRGILAGWTVILAGFWLSPMAHLEPVAQRLIFSGVFLFVSLVYQGRLFVYFAGSTLTFGLALHGLGLDLTVGDFVGFFFPPSVVTLFFAMGIGPSLLFARVAHTRAQRFEQRLRTASDEMERMRLRVGTAQEGVHLTREYLLGRSDAEAEMRNEAIDGVAADGGALDRAGLELHTASFDDTIAALRKAFADFQTRGRADGRIAGPIRFVFFAPAAGYDEKSIIAVDLERLLEGVETCLMLALDSLPEIGMRRREGVIRLSIRYGLRVIEVAVEDNGRGLSSFKPQMEGKPQAEEQLGRFKEAVAKWGGRLDRLVRLGVGSRTSLELRIVRERPRARVSSHRATVRHPILPAEI